MRLRNNTIDVFRYICSIMVVAIHTQPFSELNANMGWLFSELIPRIAVPFFFAVSGMYYAEKTLEQNDKLIILARNSIIKLVGPYFICSIPFYLVEYCRWGKNSIWNFVYFFIRTFFITGSYEPFWFYPALFLAITVFTISSYLKKQRMFLLGSILAYSLGCLGCAYFRLAKKIPIVSGFIDSDIFVYYRRYIAMGIGFFFCGYVVTQISADCKSVSKKNVKIIRMLTLAICIWLFEIIFTYYLNIQSNIIITYGLYILVIAMLLFLKEHPMQRYRKLGYMCKNLSECTYLIHPMILSIISIKFYDLNHTGRFFAVCIVAFAFGIIKSVISLFRRGVNNDK